MRTVHEGVYKWVYDVTRATMVKGICFVKANNSFYARFVYHVPDKSDPKKTAVLEEEL